MSQQLRCKICTKKVRTNSYTCKCDPESVFCDAHKYGFAHNCTISKFQENKQSLQKALPIVKASKIQLI
jgi:hypothetical protein